MKKPDEQQPGPKSGIVFHRAHPELVELLVKLTNKIRKTLGVPIARSHVVEMAIREMAKKYKITA